MSQGTRIGRSVLSKEKIPLIFNAKADCLVSSAPSQ